MPAISNPLLDHSSMRGAKGVLINITGGKDMTLYEVDSAANRIREEVGDVDANIIFGSTFNPDMNGVIRVSVVATGIDAEAIAQAKLLDQANNSLSNEVDVNDMLNNEMPSSFSEYNFEALEDLDDANGQSQFENKDLTNEVGSMDWVQEELELTSRAENKETTIQKQSFLKRMWNSLKNAESAEEDSSMQPNTKMHSHIPPNVSSKASTSVKDVPSFLQKK